jgi:hypothetical protein
MPLLSPMLPQALLSPYRLHNARRATRLRRDLLHCPLTNSWAVHSPHRSATHLRLYHDVPRQHTMMTE